jgi:hypothetical protein
MPARPSTAVTQATLPQFLASNSRHRQREESPPTPATQQSPRKTRIAKKVRTDGSDTQITEGDPSTSQTHEVHERCSPTPTPNQTMRPRSPEAHTQLTLLLNNAMATATEVISNMTATSDPSSKDLETATTAIQSLLDTMQAMRTPHEGQRIATRIVPQH